MTKDEYRVMGDEPTKTTASEELDIDQDIPAIFRKSPPALERTKGEKGNLPALIFGAAGMICLVGGLIYFFL